MTLIRRAYQVPNGKFPVGDFTPEDWREQRWGYYRMVEKVDGEIAKVLDALRETGAEENTLVIFTSDHGDCTGAHSFNQKTVLYDESANRWLMAERASGNRICVYVGAGPNPVWDGWYVYDFPQGIVPSFGHFGVWRGHTRHRCGRARRWPLRTQNAHRPRRLRA